MSYPEKKDTESGGNPTKNTKSEKKGLNPFIYAIILIVATICALSIVL
jgi:hypothetical protein